MGCDGRATYEYVGPVIGDEPDVNPRCKGPFLFRATRGKVQRRSCSLERQSAGADGRHFGSYPVWTSKRYERVAASAISLDQALRG
jgi:hypothetical protein